MKSFILFLIISLGSPVAAFLQHNPAAVIDTVETDSGMVVLFRNFTWQYMDGEPVMIDPGTDTTGIFSAKWINDQIWTFRMKPDSLKDTLLRLITPELQFTMPVTGTLLRGFMYTHKGLDIKINKGDSVRASFDGVVRYARYNRGGFGNLVILRHYNGLETYYAHLSKLMVKVNQVVKSGESIGLSGSTGRSRGPHLHWEIRYKDIPVDPMRIVDFTNGMLIADQFPVTKAVFYPPDWDPSAVYHKIKSGDTLGYLAKKYHTSVKEICAMNKITATTLLRIGRTLRVR